MSITLGTDTYGRVKTVNGTPIVTKFAMLQALPVYPLQSFYFSRFGEIERLGIPFVAGVHSVSIGGIPLAQLDRTSVVMAYLRGVFAGLTVVGFMVIFPGIMYLTGEHLDKLAMFALRLLVACFALGSVGGLLTYAIPVTSRREMRIRQHCGELLGICADPARVAFDTAVAIEEYVSQLDLSRVGEVSRLKCIQQLVSIRSQIALGNDAVQLEIETDHMLACLAVVGDE